METLQRNEVNGERIQAESATAAREAGLPRDYFENLARGIVTDFSKMHDQLSQQHRDATAASANHATQQTERLLAEHAAALQEMKRNKEMQDAIAASLQNAPGLTAQEVLRQMNAQPPPPPPADAPPDAAQGRIPALVKELQDVMKEAAHGNDVRLTQVLQQIARQLQQLQTTPLLNIDNLQLADMITTLVTDVGNRIPNALALLQQISLPATQDSAINIATRLNFEAPSTSAAPAAPPAAPPVKTEPGQIPEGTVIDVTPDEPPPVGVHEPGAHKVQSNKSGMQIVKMRLSLLMQHLGRRCCLESEKRQHMKRQKKKR